MLIFTGSFPIQFVHLKFIASKGHYDHNTQQEGFHNYNIIMGGILLPVVYIIAILRAKVELSRTHTPHVPCISELTETCRDDLLG